MTYVKPMLAGLAGGIVINVVWAVQDANYYAGVILGLVVGASTLVVLAKKVR